VSSVARVTPNPYNGSITDFAVARLDRPVTFTHRISPICLPDAPRDWLRGVDGHIFMAGAWGQRSPDAAAGVCEFNDTKTPMMIEVRELKSPQRWLRAIRPR